MVHLGFQLSSVTPYLETVLGIRKAFKHISAIGYRDVQLQGVPSDIPDWEIASALQENGLNCIATQEDFPLGFGKNPERYIERAVSCGSRYLTFALIPREITTPDGLKRFADTLWRIQEKVNRAGMIFTYHPIGNDFQLMEGVPVFERLMALLPHEMQLTFCVYGTFHSKYPWRDVLEKYRGRVDLVHFKDDIVLPDGSHRLMPLGQGSHDWRPIRNACERAGVKWAFAEQERWVSDAFECAEASYRYLQGIGLEENKLTKVCKEVL